uniref:Reverse transcriptase domain-containing protein n=1 Tax=Anolis carolinensis TaxID=28377 RepID=A0A803SSF2_ANOCA
MQLDAFCKILYFGKFLNELGQRINDPNILFLRMMEDLHHFVYKLTSCICQGQILGAQLWILIWLVDNWQIEGKNVEAVIDFVFLGAKITADADCSQEIRKRFLLGRRAMTNLNKIVESRDITLATKIHILKAIVFPIVTYGCESWTIRKAERRKTDAFELWCWRKILRVLWTARRSNQFILQEIMPDCSLEGRILETKMKYFGHIMRRQESLEKIMMLGKMEGKNKRGQQG